MWINIDTNSLRVFFFFLKKVLTILITVLWHHIVVSFYICLMTNDIDIFLCTYWLFVYLPLWSACLLNTLKLGFLLIIELLVLFAVFWIQILCVYVLWIFSPILWLAFFVFLTVSFEEQRFLKFDKVQFISFLFYSSYFYIFSRSCFLPQDCTNVILCFFYVFYSFSCYI